MDYKNPLKMIDPLTGMEMTVQPPMPANQMGAAKPMFNQTTQNVAQQVYGGLDQRQMSMGQQAPVFMKDIPEGNKGAGLRALDDSVVEQMGYDSATKMVSPLNDNHPGRNSVGAKMVGKEIPKKMSKELTDKTKVTTAYNSSYAGNPNVSNRIYNAATGLTIDQDPTYNYEKRKTYNTNAIDKYGSLEKSRRALYNQIQELKQKNK